MYIEELKGGGVDCGKEEEQLSGSGAFRVGFVAEGARRALVGAGARALFYPTLLYNVLRNKVQAEFRWWDRVDEFLLLGAVPFPSDVLRLKELGVGGVVTLNEPYETLVPTSLYHAHGIDHLVIPTRDYLFAPSLTDICQAVDFIHKNATYGQTTYVHCKAGRGRSTTIVICYLVQHKQMMPADAYDYLKSIRPRVLLASSQWQAVQEYFHLYVKRTVFCGYMTNLVMKPPVVHLGAEDLVAFDEDSIVVVTESDLDGYDPCLESGSVGSEIWADLSVVYRFRVAGQAALARISCQWLGYHANQNISREMLLVKQGLTVDIQVY